MLSHKISTQSAKDTKVGTSRSQFLKSLRIIFQHESTKQIMNLEQIK